MPSFFTYKIHCIVQILNIQKYVLSLGCILDIFLQLRKFKPQYSYKEMNGFYMSTQDRIKISCLVLQFPYQKKLRQILGKIDHRGIFNSLYNYLEFYTDIYVPKFREDTRLSKISKVDLPLVLLSKYQLEMYIKKDIMRFQWLGLWMQKKVITGQLIRQQK